MIPGLGPDHAMACAMDMAWADQYEDLADAFESGCNHPAADAFRTLAAWHRDHAADLVPKGQTPDSPSLPRPVAAFPWGDDMPDIANPDAVHYLMWPWHVYGLAIEHKVKSSLWFAQAGYDAIAQRETEHLLFLRSAQASLPLPPDDWADDDDPEHWDM